MSRARRVRKTRIVSSIAALALVVAACGGAEEEVDEGPSEEVEEPEEAEEPEEPDEEPEAEAESVLAGATIEFVVPFNPGGGYDTYARLIAPELESALGATVTVSNVPGAGGLVALNQTWAGRTDGTLIQIVEGASALLAELSGQEEVQFQAAEFDWLSGVLGEPTVVTTSADGDITDIDSMIAAAERDGALRLTSTGVMNAHSVAGLVLERALGVPVQIIGGFDGTDAAFGAVLRGEAHGLLASIGTGSSFANAGEGNIIVSLSNERPGFAQDVVALGELDVDPDAVELIEMQSAIADITRAVVAPPGTDAAAVAELRAAFEQVLTDPAFLQEAADQGRDLEWRSGEEVQSMVVAALGSPPDAYLALIEETFERAAG